MVRNAILSYSSMELETAYDVIRADDNVDDLYFVLKNSSPTTLLIGYSLLRRNKHTHQAREHST